LVAVLLTRVLGWNQASKENCLKGVVREAISSMVCANAHLQACLGAAGAGESSSSPEWCLPRDQRLASSRPSACNTASASSKSYNKLLSALAGNGSKNRRVVGKQDVRLWDVAIQGATPPAGIHGVLAHMKRGPEPRRRLAADPSRAVLRASAKGRSEGVGWDISRAPWEPARLTTGLPEGPARLESGFGHTQRAQFCKEKFCRCSLAVDGMIRFCDAKACLYIPGAVWDWKSPMKLTAHLAK